MNMMLLEVTNQHWSRNFICGYYTSTT